MTAALRFDESRAEAVLLPTPTLVTVPEEVTPAQIEELTAATGLSRFPVSRPDGELIGYLHVKDALDAGPAERHTPIPGNRVRQLPTVGPNDPLHIVLATMRARGAHMARVADADGTLSGVVALEDVLEELVGEIRDATQQR
jgi:CBS domain containing-hemolysin-like protein